MRVSVEGQAEVSQRMSTIGVIGGTGALGRGLALRLAAAGHHVRIGSRDPSRAKEAAAPLGDRTTGGANADVCDSDMVIVAVPWLAHEQTIAGLRDELEGRIVVDCVNPLGFDERGPFALSVDAGSAAEQAQQLLPGSVVVGAFHHVSAELLLDAEELDTDPRGLRGRGQKANRLAIPARKAGGGDHLGEDEPGAHLQRDRPEGTVGDARHRGEKERVGQLDAAEGE